MRRLAALCALLVLLLSGCGASVTGSPPPGDEATTAAPPEEMDVAAAPGTAEAAPVPDASENSESEEAVTEYTYEASVVESGRTLTLRLHGRRDTSDGFERLGVSAIDVLEGNSLLQTVSVGEAFRQQGLEEWVGQYPWTNCWTEDGSLTTDDLNFDGYPDLRLMADVGVVNISYLCWLWDPDTEQFRYAFELVGYDVQADADTQQLVTESRGAGHDYTDYYRYDNEAHTLVHLNELHISAEEVGGIYEVHELIDGQWVQTQ